MRRPSGRALWLGPPALLILAGYLGLTWLACSFQPDRTVDLLGTWLELANREPAFDLEVGRHAIVAIGAATLLVMGVFCHLHRRSDPLLLAGIVALVAQFWCFHRWYDELLILLPMLALLRLCLRLPRAARLFQVCRLAFWMTLALSLAPGGRYLELLPGPARAAYLFLQQLDWLAVLALLALIARLQQHPEGSLARRLCLPRTSYVRGIVRSTLRAAECRHAS